MAERVVVGELFDGVSEGVSVVEDGTEAGFLFIDAHDFGLDFATSENQVLENLVVVLLDSLDVFFDVAEEFLVVDDAVLDNFG